VFFLSKEKKRMITSRGVGGKKKAVNIDDRAQDRHTRFGAGGGTISTTHQFPFFFFFFLGPLVFSSGGQGIVRLLFERKSQLVYSEIKQPEREIRDHQRKNGHGMYFR
jgi:hypothetical protein